MSFKKDEYSKIIAIYKFSGVLWLQRIIWSTRQGSMRSDTYWGLLYCCYKELRENIV